MKTLVILGFVLFVGSIGMARAQECPRADPSGPLMPSATRVLAGKIVFHEDIRSWFGLQLDAPVCGIKEIQLVPDTSNETAETKGERLLETLRGCRATVRGKLNIPGTLYFSAEMFQDVDEAKPEAECVLKKPFPDYDHAQPDPSIHRYEVTMTMEYQKPRRMSFVVSSGGRILRPWQAYAKYSLNGALDFTGYCVDGFDLKFLGGTPESKPWTMDNQVLMSPEWAAKKGVWHIVMRYECRRTRERQ